MIHHNFSFSPFSGLFCLGLLIGLTGCGGQDGWLVGVTRGGTGDGSTTSGDGSSISVSSPVSADAPVTTTTRPSPPPSSNGSENGQSAVQYVPVYAQLSMPLTPEQPPTDQTVTIPLYTGPALVPGDLFERSLSSSTVQPVYKWTCNGLTHELYLIQFQSNLFMPGAPAFTLGLDSSSIRQDDVTENYTGCPGKLAVYNQGNGQIISQQTCNASPGMVYPVQDGYSPTLVFAPLAASTVNNNIQSLVYPAQYSRESFTPVFTAFPALPAPASYQIVVQQKYAPLSTDADYHLATDQCDEIRFTLKTQ